MAHVTSNFAVNDDTLVYWSWLGVEIEAYLLSALASVIHSIRIICGS